MPAQEDARAVTPAEYRSHPNRAIRRAFFRGQDAARAGASSLTNPYRRIGAIARARRGSWTESYVAAWLAGWRETANRPPGAGLDDPATHLNPQEEPPCPKPRP